MSSRPGWHAKDWTAKADTPIDATDAEPDLAAVQPLGHAGTPSSSSTSSGKLPAGVVLAQARLDLLALLGFEIEIYGRADEGRPPRPRDLTSRSIPIL